MSITNPCLCLRHNELHRGDFAPHLCQSVAFWCPPCRSDPVRRSLECLLSPTQLGKGSNPNPSRSCPLSGLSGREFVFPGQRHCMQCHHPSALSAPGPASFLTPSRGSLQNTGQVLETIHQHLLEGVTPSAAPAGWHLQLGRIWYGRRRSVRVGQTRLWSRAV